MVIDDNAFVMLMKQERFRGLIADGIGGATAAEVPMSLPAESPGGPGVWPSLQDLGGRVWDFVLRQSESRNAPAGGIGP